MRYEAGSEIPPCAGTTDMVEDVGWSTVVVDVMQTSRHRWRSSCNKQGVRGALLNL